MAHTPVTPHDTAAPDMTALDAMTPAVAAQSAVSPGAATPAVAAPTAARQGTTTPGAATPAEPTPGTTLSHVNAMPAPTWSWLKMNDVTVEIPDGLVTAGQAGVEVEVPAEARGTFDDFTAALAAADARFTNRRAAAPGDAADQARAAAPGHEEILDVPALSRYQQRAVHLEEECGPAASFAHGMGDDATRFLRQAAGEPIVIHAVAGTRVPATVRVCGVDGAISAADIAVIAEADSAVELTLALDSPTKGTGVVGALLSVAAAARARVSITCVQTLDDTWQALDSSGYFLDEGARVEIRHVVLGAGASYTGLAAELYGNQSNISVDTDYIGTRSQIRDFNYQIRQIGHKTESLMDANGVLAGTSKKTLRGTIDLVHGCKGSEGTERETVLIADEKVENKTVPVILCDEDDVAGNHGATIGHVRPDQLFYLQSRGVSAEAAEALFLRAKLEDAVFNAPDARVRASVIRLGRALVDDFAETVEEDVA